MCCARLLTGLSGRAYEECAIAAAVLRESAAIVRPVLTAPTDGSTEASATYRPLTPCTSPLGSATDTRGSSPTHAPPDSDLGIGLILGASVRYPAARKASTHAERSSRNDLMLYTGGTSPTILSPTNLRPVSDVPSPSVT